MIEQAAIPDQRKLLLQQLTEFLPAASIITDDESLKPFECDALTLYHELHLLVVLPETVEQVQRIMKLCHKLAIPVVARGSGTGLCAGAMPHPEGIVLSLSKFSEILEIDPLARTATVQPGVTNPPLCPKKGFYNLTRRSSKRHQPPPIFIIPSSSCGRATTRNARGVMYWVLTMIQSRVLFTTKYHCHLQTF